MYWSMSDIQCKDVLEVIKTQQMAPMNIINKSDASKAFSVYLSLCLLLLL